MKMAGPNTGTAGAAAGMTGGKMSCRKGTSMVKGYKKSNGTMVKGYCRKSA
jgi:hypothetical protein